MRSPEPNAGQIDNEQVALMPHAPFGDRDVDALRAKAPASIRAVLQAADVATELKHKAPSMHEPIAFREAQCGTPS